VRLGRVAGLTSFPATGLRSVGRSFGWQAGLVVVLVGYLVAAAKRSGEPLLAPLAGWIIASG
jgi:hypothetical protein